MSPLQLKFARFKAGALGRTIDIVLGLALIWWGSGIGSIIDILAMVIGLFIFTSGVFNICWLAFLIGIPFRGKDIPPAH